MRYDPYPNPEFVAGGEKSEWLAEPLVAHLPGVRMSVLAHASDRAAVAASILAGHSRWGSGHSSVFIEPAGGPDWLVGIEDLGEEADGGGNKAMAIEGETHALSTAFGTPEVSQPDVRRDKHGRFVKRGEGGTPR